MLIRSILITFLETVIVNLVAGTWKMRKKKSTHTQQMMSERVHMKSILPQYPTTLTQIRFGVGKELRRAICNKIVLADLRFIWCQYYWCRFDIRTLLTESSQKSLLSTSTYWDMSSSSIAFWKSKNFIYQYTT